MANSQYLGRDSSSLVEQVAVALADNRWRYRTARGIAEELGVPEGAVEDALLKHPDIARRSKLRSRSGEQAWRAASRPTTAAELLASFRRLLARDTDQRVPHQAS
jgi:hypothetical protein